MNPEELARQNIDEQLLQAGWLIQDRVRLNLTAGRGVAVRQFPLETGFADYLLSVDRKAVGVIEAKPEGVTLSGVAEQAGMYAVGLPKNIPHVGADGVRPDELPFIYESTGVETLFRDNRDPQAALAPGLHLPSPGNPGRLGLGETHLKRTPAAISPVM
jgi:type I restriction enzyme R subunit